MRKSEKMRRRDKGNISALRDNSLDTRHDTITRSIIYKGWLISYKG